MTILAFAAGCIAGAYFIMIGDWLADHPTPSGSAARTDRWF